MVLNRQAETAKIPQKVTTLSICWLNHRFAATGIHRGEVTGAWETTIAAEIPPDFAGLIREAVHQTAYHGSTVSFLLANSKLSQKLVEVPPVTGASLIKIIQQEARQHKLFEGEAAWAFQSSATVKGVRRVILHSLPKTLLDQLIQACQQNGLHLHSVAPVSAVLHQQLMELPLSKGEVAVLVAETGSSTTVVAGRADGQLLLVRTLMDTWQENTPRLALDLKRTLAFITQQYDLDVTAGVWLFDSGAAPPAALLQRQLELPVTVSPVACQPDYWMIESAKLRPALTPNFIGLELQKAPQRRRFAWVVAASTGLFVLASLTFAVILNRQARQEAANAVSLRQQAGRLQAQQQDLEARNTELAGKAQLIKLILEDQRPPVPVWILGYLSEAVPAELVVTNLHVKWDEDSWRLHLAGTLQATSQPPAPLALSNAVDVLASRLVSGPFHLLILRRSDRAEATPEKSRTPDNALGMAKNPAPVENQFWLDGVMR